MGLSKIFFALCVFSILANLAVSVNVDSDISLNSPRDGALIKDKGLTGAGPQVKFAYQVKTTPRNIPITCKAMIDDNSGSGFVVANVATLPKAGSAFFSYQLKNGLEYDWTVECSATNPTDTLRNYYVNEQINTFTTTSIDVFPKDQVIFKKPFVEFKYQSTTKNPLFPSKCSLYFEDDAEPYYEFTTPGKSKKTLLLSNNNVGYIWHLECFNGIYKERTPDYFFAVETDYDVTLLTDGHVESNPVDLSYVYDAYHGENDVTPQLLIKCELFVDGVKKDGANLKYKVARPFSMLLAPGEHKAHVSCPKAYSGEYVFEVE